MNIETSFEIKISDFEYIDHNIINPENHNHDSSFQTTDFFGESIIYFILNSDDHFTQINHETF